MKTYSYFSLLSLLFISIISNAQEKKPIEFSDYEVEWFQEPWVDSLSVYDQEFDLVRESIIYEDFIMNIYTNNFLYPFGFLIQKLDLYTGNVQWSYNEFSEEKYTRRFVKDFKLINDTLELYLFEESETIFNFTYPRWDSCHLALLKIDMSDGSVIESIKSNHNDSLNLALSKDPFNTSNQVVFGNQNGYELIKSEEIDRNDSIRVENYIRLEIGRDGYLINSDTTTLEFPPIRTTFNQNYPYNSDSIISHVEFSFSQSSTFSSIIIMDKDLQTYDSIQLHNYYNHDSIKYQLLYSFKNDKLLIETAGQFSIDFDYKQNFFLFNSKGELLTKVNNAINLSERAESILPFAFDSNNNILGFGTYQDFAKDSLTHLFFWKSIRNNGIDTLLDFKIKNKDINVSPSIAYLTKNNDVVAYYSYIQPSYPSEIGPEFPAPRWNFWIKVRGEDLGLKTSSSDEDLSYNSFEIYPNPVTDFLNISANKIEGKIHIRDITGMLFYKADYRQPENMITIDVSTFDSGIYFLSYFNKKGDLVETIKFIKF